MELSAEKFAALFDTMIAAPDLVEPFGYVAMYFSALDAALNQSIDWLTESPHKDVVYSMVEEVLSFRARMNMLAKVIEEVTDPTVKTAYADALKAAEKANAARNKIFHSQVEGFHFDGTIDLNTRKGVINTRGENF